VIDAQDLWVALAALGFEPREEDFRKIMQEIDKNGTGKVSLDNFVQIMINKLFEWPSDEEVRKGFQQVLRSLHFSRLQKMQMPKCLDRNRFFLVLEPMPSPRAI